MFFSLSNYRTLVILNMKTGIRIIILVLALAGTIKAQSINVTPTGVGIGTATPTQKLDVAGNVNAAGNLVATGDISAGGKFTITGNVGIGTTAPGNKLHVAGPGGYSYQDGALRLQMSNDDLYFYRPTENRFAIQTTMDGAGVQWSSLSLQSDGGNVGIGTTEPGNKLHVAGPGGYSYKDGALRLQMSNDDLYFYRPTENRFAIQTTMDGAGVQWSSLSLQPDGGNVGIGTTNPTHKLEVSGNIKMGGGIYSAQRPDFVLVLQADRNMVLYDNGGAVWNSGTSLSDIRIKDDIVGLAPVLEKIDQIRVVEFNYKPGIYDDQRHVGFIAQEIEALYPDFVYTEPKSGRKLVQYDKMSTIAVAGVKELKAEYKAALEDLKKEIADLRAEVELLKSMQR
jgi:hypothetical protein